MEALNLLVSAIHKDEKAATLTTFRTQTKIHLSLFEKIGETNIRPSIARNDGHAGLIDCL